MLSRSASAIMPRCRLLRAFQETSILPNAPLRTMSTMFSPLLMSSLALRTSDSKWTLANPRRHCSSKHPEEISETDKADRDEVISLVDEQIRSQSYGRLFAVVYINEQQKKVTTGDVLLLRRDMGCEIGSQIVLDKIVMVGGKDFSLIGRPILPRDLVRVEATVVEKNLAKTTVWFDAGKKPMRGTHSFERPKETTLRINRIKLLCPIEEAKDRYGYEIRNEDPTFL